MRRFVLRHQLNGIVAPKPGALDAIFETRQLRPFAGAITQVVREVSAITIGNGGKNPRTVFALFEGDFSNSWKVFAQLIFIFRNGRAQLVIPDLLIKIDVRVRLLALMRIPS